MVLRIAFLLAAALLTPWWASTHPAADELEKPPIKIGVVLPLTGEESDFGRIEQNSFLMGAEEINRAGGVKGRKIEVVIEDDLSQVAVAKGAVRKLISQDKVVMLAGGYSSELTFAMCALAQKEKVPFLVNTAAADKITEQGWDYVFRLATPASEHAGALVSFLSEVVKPKTVAIIHPNNLFGESGSKRFMEHCKKIGARVLLKEAYKREGDRFAPFLTKAKQLKPDLVYVIAYVMDAATFMRDARDLDFNPQLFVGGAAGFTMYQFAQAAGDAAENVFTVAPWTPSVTYPGARRYYENYLKNFGSPPEYHGAQAYAAMYVIADALQRAKELTPAAVRDALSKTDMMTAFGPVKFIAYGKKTQQNSLPAYVAQWQKGKLETVWPRGVADKPYVFPMPPWRKA